MTTNLFRYITPAGGNTVVDYTGKNHILDRNMIDASLDYRWYRDITGYTPDFETGARADFKMLSQTTTLYPLFRKHAFWNVNLELFAKKTFQAFNGLLKAGVCAIGYAGSGTKKEDGTYASTTSTSIKSFDSYLDKTFEYETAARAGAGLELTYTRIVSERWAPYVTLSDRFQSLLSEPQYLDGRTRNVAMLTLGCSF